MSRILHFGPGNFFRAHLAEYTHDAGGWTIDVVSLRSPEFRDAYKSAYTLAVQGQGARRIDVIRDALVAPEDPAAVIARIADPAVQVISATVTEKGYMLRSDGTLDLDAVQGELTGPPRSLIGYLAQGLAQRTAPVTVLSCDNRLGNGDALEAAVRAFAQAGELTLTCAVTFPNAMVDRITPASTDTLRAEHGDPLVVPCEPFKEWVIEDRFAASRPDWPGVRFVTDVAAHEMRKLRMLNGAHSYLAYAGVLAGHDYVHQAISDPTLRTGALTLMTEAETTVPDEGRVSGYAEALIARFENPHLHHALRQIAMDGSQKLPYRMGDTLRARGAQASPGVVAGIRAWLDFVQHETDAGRALQDPLAADLAAAQSDRARLERIGLGDLAGALSL